MSISHTLHIELWSPLTGFGAIRRGYIYDAEGEVTRVWPAGRGVGTFSVRDDHPTLPELLAPGTRAHIVVDGVDWYSGTIENQRGSLIRGRGVVTVDVRDDYCILDGALAWPNPAPGGRIVVKNNAGSTTYLTVSPWTSGQAQPVDVYDQAQIGPRGTLDVEGRLTTGSTAAAQAAVRMLPDDWEWNPDEGRPFSFSTRGKAGYWERDIDATGETEAEIVRQVVDKNVRQRLGYPIQPTSKTHMGRYLTGGSSVGGATNQRPAPQLRFDSIGEWIERWLSETRSQSGAYATAPLDPWLGYRLVADPVTGTLEQRFETANDASSRALTPESGIVVGGEWQLGSAPVTRVLVGGQGDLGERALKSVDSPQRASLEAAWGLRTEVFRDETGEQPEWPEAVPDYERIPKYHHVHPRVPNSMRTTYQNVLQRGGEKALADGASIPSVTADITETPFFQFKAEGATGAGEFGLGTRVRVQTDLIDITDRIRSVTISWSASEGVIVTPTVGIPADADDSLLDGVGRIAGAVGRIQAR